MKTQTIITLAVVLMIAIVIIWIVMRIRKALHRSLGNIRSTLVDAKQLMSVLNQTDAAGTLVEPRNVGGATSMFLRKIKQDFPQFQNDDAEAEVESVLSNYLYYRYGNAKKFESSLVHSKLFADLKKESNGIITNLRFNGIAIYNYEKEDEFATITYKCSVGFDLDGRRNETRWVIKYSNRLRDPDDAILAMKCPNCGAPLGNTRGDACPYCGAKLTRDTTMAWQVIKIDID